ILDQSVYVPFGVGLQDEKDQKQLTRALQYYLSKDKVKKIKNYSVLGNQVNLDFFLPQLPLFFEESAIKHRFDKELFRQYALEIGTALNVLEKDPIQFRQDSFLSKKHIKKLKHKTVTVGLSAILILASLFAVSRAILYFQVNKIEKQINSIIDHTHTTNLHKVKTGLITKNLLFNWIDQLDELRDIFEKKNPATHFHKSPRRVSEFLYWMSNHPKLQEGLRVEMIKYEMVQNPNLDKPYQAFSVKIHLAFYTPDPHIARDFHNFLIEKKDPFIDEKKDIVWNREGEKYSFQFFLKNPSPH
ncbi:MAG: hypothetical protein HY860_05680, partial [Chlamydiales bacterium]|nr:hypothetical protein [Chlamydiales bacterium]